LNVYGLAPVSGGCHWYRIREPLRGLAGLGHTTEFGELFDESIVRRHDTILTHILHGERETEAWGYLADGGQHRLVYDIDDNLWRYTEGTEHQKYWNPERIAQVEGNIRRAHLVTTPSPVIADLVRFKLGLNDNVAVLPNTVPEWLLKERRTQPLAFTVGYQGAPQRLHQSDLDEIQVELFHFMSKCPEARLRFFGQPKSLEGAGPFADRVEYVPWNPDVPAYYRSLHGMTVGIGPLRRSEYTEAKSGIRAVEFAALGIPGVFSSSAPYNPFVKHRETGYLVSSISDWRKYLIKLCRSPDQVERMSKRARQWAMSWTTEENAILWEKAYQGSGPDVKASSAR
jgi:glycosyltransferase involved in cell wall biosynthesis